MKSSVTQIVYAPRPDATSEGELNALASIYRFILDRHAKKEDYPTTSDPEPDAAVRVKYGEEVSHVEQQTR